MDTFKHRWGVRYTQDPTKDVDYLQTISDNTPDFARPGELFLNESRHELYYVDSVSGVAKTLLQLPRGLKVIDFSSSIELDALHGDVFKLVLIGDSEILEILNPILGQEYILLVYQDSVGFWNLGFDSKFILKQQYIPQEANTLKVFRLIYDGSNFIEI